jgi:DNA-binding transcriptional MerR regulator
MHMSVIVSFPGGGPAKGLERVQSTYTVREISRQFGLSEHFIRRWTREGMVRAVEPDETGELRFDFHALTQFRRARELRSRGLSMRQIEAELNGQLNLFPERGGMLIPLPVRMSPFEEALILHEQNDPRAPAMYRRAIEEGECVADAYCNLGIMAYEKNNIPRAFDHFTRSLQHDARHFESHFNLGHIYFEAGDLRLARLHYDFAAAIEPCSAGAHFNLGLIDAMEGDTPAAIASLHRARRYATEEELGQIEETLAGLQRNPNGPRPE